MDKGGRGVPRPHTGLLLWTSKKHSTVLTKHDDNLPALVVSNYQPAIVFQVSTERQSVVQVKVRRQLPDVWLAVGRLKHSEEHIDCILLVAV